MFGNTNAGSSGFSFGQNNNNSNANAGTNNTGGFSSGFKFGSGSATQNTNTGTTNTSGGGLFGQNNNNNNAGASNTTGGGLFGQNNANNTNAGTSGGLFGNNNNNTANTNTGGGLFGNNNANTSTNNTGGGLFGNNANSNANTSTNTGGGLFGNNANANTNTNTGGFFGNNANTTNNNATNQTGGGLFGNNNNANAAQPSGGLFGKPAGGFGAANTTTNTNTGFGQAQPQQANQTFNQQSGFGQLTTQRGQPSGPSVQAQLTRIKDGWDPTSPNCAFQHYFYNRVPQDQVPFYQMPQGQSPEKWDKAVAERPYDSCVPVLAVGFTDLQKRTKLQEQQVTAYRVRMHEVNSKLDELTNKHDLVTTVKIAEMRARHQRLVNRTVALAAVTQVLRNRGYVLKPEEEVLRKNLEELYARVTDPAVFGRINEIWARMSVLREQARHATDALTKKAPDGTILTWERDEETLEQLAKILKAQQTGIAFLAKVLKEDMADVEAKISSLEKK